MSLDATLWAWKQELKPTMKIILLSLADRADETHCCFPSIKRLELDTGLNRKTIVKNLKFLQEKELIRHNGKFVGKTKQVKVYELLGVNSRDLNSPKNGTVPKTEQYQKRTLNSTKNGTVKQSQKRYWESPNILTSNINLLDRTKSANSKTTRGGKTLIELMGEFKELYDSKTLNDFYLYWTETNENGKEGWTIPKTWDTKKRLIRWANNNFKSNRKHIQQTKLINFSQGTY